MRPVTLPSEFLLRQLVISEIDQQQLVEKPINYRKGKTTKQAYQARILCAQSGMKSPEALIDHLLQVAFEKFFEGDLENGKA